MNPWRFCNSILRASIEKGSPHKALLDFTSLLRPGTVRPDHRTLALVLEACRISSNLGAAVCVHARIAKTGLDAHVTVANSLFNLYLNSGRVEEAHRMLDGMREWDSDPVPGNLLIAGYLRSGEFGMARQVFEQMPVTDLVSWNSVIAGCVRGLQPREAIVLFHRMLRMGFQPDGFTFSTTLSACARIGALRRGEWIHRLMSEENFELNHILSAALIHMYAKCGKIEMGRMIFNLVPRADVSVWNSMISGLAIHGLGPEATGLFSRMEKEGVTPDAITFVGLLTACSHCGLVREGRHYFDLMKQKYSIEPLIEHYGTVVDLLARAGHLQEAFETIKAMPMTPDIVIWRSLLSACRVHQQSKLGEIVVREMVGCESGDYVLLSNIYSLTNRWSSAEQVWEEMKGKKIRKDRGLSWVELGGAIHEFKAGDRLHPESDAIHRALGELMKRAKANGFVPVTATVAMDVLDEEKEENLSCHSEKLAITYGFLKTGPLKEIRVSKNLRTCVDCHSWLKVVSKMLCRVIIVRDRIRFHRFESGSCSCRDYW